MNADDTTDQRPASMRRRVDFDTLPEPTTAPVTAEGLRERVIAVIKSVRIHPKLDSAVTAMIMAGAGFHVTDDEAAPLADAIVAALAGDPGDLPARMLTAMRQHRLDERSDDPPGLTICVCGEQIIDFKTHLARVAMSVRWEHAARQAAEVERLRGQAKERGELAARRQSELITLRPEVERLRAELAAALDHDREAVRMLNAAEADLERLAATVAERDTAVAAVRTAQITHIRDTHPDRMHVGACLGCQVLVPLSLAMPSRPDDPEEIRRLMQATTEETNDG